MTSILSYARLPRLPASPGFPITTMFTWYPIPPEPQAPMVDISALARTGIQARSRYGSVMAPPSGQRLRMRGGRSLSQVGNRPGEKKRLRILAAVILIRVNH